MPCFHLRSIFSKYPQHQCWHITLFQIPRPRKLCSSPEVFLACCRHFICRWCHCFQSVKLLNIVTIMFNHNIFSCGIDFKQPILHFMQICYIGASWLSSLRQQFSSLWGLEVWNWCEIIFLDIFLVFLYLEKSSRHCCPRDVSLTFKFLDPLPSSYGVQQQKSKLTISFSLGVCKHLQPIPNSI